MTIGIYALYWAEQDLVYVGKSQAIEHRWADHRLSASRNEHTNYNVQLAYNLYGQPEYLILDVTDLSSLSYKEELWTKEFDALNPVVGLCIVPPNGYTHNTSVYTTLQILKVFSLLYRKQTKIERISTRTKVNIATIKKIAVGKLHIWLKERYPKEYSLLESRTAVPTSSFSNAILKGIDGATYTIRSITNFCKQHPVLKDTWNYDRSRISLVLKGTLEEYKGFKKFRA